MQAPALHPVTQAVLDLLRSANVPFRELQHAPTRTSEESAAARGEPLELGGKALLLKTGDVFRLFVLSAARKLDAEPIRARFGAKRVRFASRDELLSLTGLEPGSVPPFGRPVLPFDLLVDGSIVQNDRIAFNAGSLTHSVILSVPDYLRVAQPELLNFSQPA